MKCAPAGGGSLGAVRSIECIAAQRRRFGQGVADRCEEIEIVRRGDPAQLERELHEPAAVDAVAGAAAREARPA